MRLDDLAPSITIEPFGPMLALNHCPTSVEFDSASLAFVSRTDLNRFYLRDPKNSGPNFRLAQQESTHSKSHL
jgi:hypothetical protein